MRKLLLGGVLLLFFACRSSSNTSASASDKPSLRIGYTNLERVLQLMPEAQAVDSQLRAYQASLLQPIQQKQAALEKQYQNFLELQQKGLLAPVEAEQRQKELLKLNEEVQRLQIQAEEKLYAKRAELLQPLSDKLQKVIEELAQEEGYDYIFNNSNATGMAFLLHAPKEHDVTKRLLKRLGVSPDSLPDEEPK
jgi:outer membrane protein